MIRINRGTEVARKAAGVALAGALAGTGALGIVGEQMTEPTAAQAKTSSQDWYTYVWNNKHAGSSTHEVKLVGNTLRLVGKNIMNGNGARYYGTNKAKSSYRISSKCKYYWSFKQKTKKGKDPEKDYRDCFVMNYSKQTTKNKMLSLLKKANAKRSDNSSAREWAVAFQVKSGKVVKLAAKQA